MQTILMQNTGGRLPPPIARIYCKAAVTSIVALIRDGEIDRQIETEQHQDTDPPHKVCQSSVYYLLSPNPPFLALFVAAGAGP